MPRPPAGELEQQPPERVGLVFVEPRRRFVEQQHTRRGAERAGELDEPGRAGGERVDLPVGDRADPDLFEQLVGDGAGVVLLGGPAPAHLERDEHVLARGEAAERLEPLERARDAEPGPRVALGARHVAPVEADAPARRLLQPGDDVEERRLARAVRTDQPGDLPGLDLRSTRGRARAGRRTRPRSSSISRSGHRDQSRRPRRRRSAAGRRW